MFTDWATIVYHVRSKYYGLCIMSAKKLSRDLKALDFSGISFSLTRFSKISPDYDVLSVRMTSRLNWITKIDFSLEHEIIPIVLFRNNGVFIVHFICIDNLNRTVSELFLVKSEKFFFRKNETFLSGSDFCSECTEFECECFLESYRDSSRR